MYVEKESFETFSNKISKELGFKIDPNSFDNNILFTLFKSNENFKDEYNKILDSLVFENMKGKDLDNFLSFFNIFRKREKDENLMDVAVIYNSNKVLTINKGCKIKIENNNYLVLKTVSIKGKDVINVQKIGDSEIENQVFGKNGDIIFDKNFISNIDNLENEVSKIILVSLNSNVLEQESDFEFLERSKNLLQSLGYNNQEKIKFEILKDKRIKNIKIQEEENVCNIIIYPRITEQLDDIISSNKHIVEYYKDRIIELVKPNLITIDIIGLSEQISFFITYKNLIEDITNKIKDYLNSLFVEENKITINKLDIILLIKEHLKNFKSLEVDYDSIEVRQNFYFRNNYNIPIFQKNIKTTLDIEDTNLVSLGKVM